MGHLIVYAIVRTNGGTPLGPYKGHYRAHPRPLWGPSIYVSPHAPSGVKAFMSVHSKTPYITPSMGLSMGFLSGNGVARGPGGLNLGFALERAHAAGGFIRSTPALPVHTAWCLLLAKQGYQVKGQLRCVWDVNSFTRSISTFPIHTTVWCLLLARQGCQAKGQVRCVWDGNSFTRSISTFPMHTVWCLLLARQGRRAKGMVAHLEGGALLDPRVDAFQHRFPLLHATDAMGDGDEVGVVVNKVTARVCLGAEHVVRVDLRGVGAW